MERPHILATVPECWRVTLPCTRAEAEAIAAADPFPGRDDPPVLNTLEPDPARPEEWLLEAYAEAEPDAATLAAIAALAPSFAGVPRVEPVAARDWVTLSQAGLEPIRAGRFLVHTAAHAAGVAPGTIALRIEAGRAFGTGHHATTAGCLALLDRLAARGERFANIADIGTGSGLLAFAALALWPGANALAADIDPVAIDVARENAAANGVALGGQAGTLATLVADGLDHPAIAGRAPFDLVIANILAQPLIDLAPAIGAATASGGRVILAGLLDHQAAAVLRAYDDAGLAPAAPVDPGEWPALLLRRRS